MVQRRSPRFIGRTHELAALLGLLGRVEGGRPAAALVAGEAGVGKTRLLQELARRAEERGVQVLVGACMPLGGDLLPYAPFVEALRGRLEDFDRPDGPVGPSTRAYQFERVLGLLTDLAAERPLVLVLEDLHWADRTTLHLLVFLVRNLRSGPVGIIGSYRNDELRRDHPLRQVAAELGRDDAVMRLDLLPFERAETIALLTAIQGEPVDRTVALRIHERSQGNPFVAEELLVAGGGSGEPLPGTLRDAVLARLAGLDPAALEALRACAAAGGRIEHALLAAVVGAQRGADAPPRPPGHSEQAVREAVDRGLLVPDEGGAGYAFRHEPVCEAVYADLLPFERARLHAAIADALRALPAPAWDWRRPAEVAAHRLAAHDLGAALEAFVAAGDAVGKVGAFAESRAQFETALELWERVPDAPARAGCDRVQLLLCAAEGANLAGDPARALARARARVWRRSAGAPGRGVVEGRALGRGAAGARGGRAACPCRCRRVDRRADPGDLCRRRGRLRGCRVPGGARRGHRRPRGNRGSDQGLAGGHARCPGLGARAAG